MGLTVLPADPYFEGPARSTELGRYQVAIAGRGFLLDDASGEHQWRSIPLLREQVDMGERPGEASINPQAGWRRSQESWHLGAGQDAYDRLDSDPFRFSRSRGIDPWTPWQLSLLPDVTSHGTSTADTQFLVVVGSRLWWVRGDTLSNYDGDDWATAITHSKTMIAAASDGEYLYVSDGDDVFRLAADAATLGSAWNDLDPDHLAFVNGRLIAAHGNAMYEIVDNTVPSAHYLHPSSTARWVGFAGGPSAIYGAVQVGDVATIYRIGVDPTDGSLTEPTIAAQFTGETVRSIGSYANTVLLVGTDEGFRIGTFQGEGVIVGARVDTGGPVRAWHGWREYVWFGWDNFDGTSGLGRIDLTRFTTDLSVFAYATDLMATAGDGPVTAVTTFQGRRWFTTGGTDGNLYQESSTLVTSGWIETGQINHGLPDLKTLEQVTVTGDPMVVSVAHNIDGAGWEDAGTINLTDTSDLIPGVVSGERIDLRFTLTRGSNPDPAMYRWTIVAEPHGSARWFVFAPLLIVETEIGPGGAIGARNPRNDVDFLLEIARAGRVVTWQEGARTSRVRIVDWQWRPTHMTNDRAAWNGTMTLQMKVV